MELCHSNLENLLNKNGAFDNSVAKDYVYQTCLGLKYLHDKNIIHRDLKLTNLLIIGKCIKIADFGLSKMIYENNSSNKDYKTGGNVKMTGIGYRKTAPPEQFQTTDYGTEVDMWCVGVIAFELLTNKLTFAWTQDARRGKVIFPVFPVVGRFAKHFIQVKN